MWFCTWWSATDRAKWCGMVRQGRRYGPSTTYKITPCWVTRLQPQPGGPPCWASPLAFGLMEADAQLYSSLHAFVVIYLMFILYVLRAHLVTGTCFQTTFNEYLCYIDGKTSKFYFWLRFLLKRFKHRHFTSCSNMCFIYRFTSDIGEIFSGFL